MGVRRSDVWESPCILLQGLLILDFMDALRWKSRTKEQRLWRCTLECVSRNCAFSCSVVARREYTARRLVPNITIKSQRHPVGGSKTEISIFFEASFHNTIRGMSRWIS